MEITTELLETIGDQSVEDFCKILEAVESKVDYDRVIYARAATDLYLFATLFFPHYCKHPFNQFHEDDFKAFEFGERKVRRARGAPRGYAKSTLKALIKPIHDLCYRLEKFIVIFSNTESQALGKLKDIRTELLTNARLIELYRIRFSRKLVAEGSFEVSADGHSCKFEAYGSGAQVRGIRHGADRPSKIILDDVEHSEEVENEAIRQKYFDWYQEDVVKIGDENTNIEFIGTVLHRSSLLKTLLDNPMYDSKIYKAVVSWSEREDLWEDWKKRLNDLELPQGERLANAMAFYKANETEMLKGTKVLWPEKEPYVDLMKEYVEIGRRAFMKEKQNEPQGGDDRVFMHFKWCRDHEKDGERGILIEESGVFIPFKVCRAYGAMDPSTGQTKARANKKGDFTCILTGLVDPKGRLIAHRDWTKRAPPTEYIQQLLLQNDEWKYEKAGVETNLYRNLLMPNIETARKNLEKERGRLVKLALYDIENIENKEKRIYTLEPKITNGYILLNRALSQEFKNQLEDFPRADHDDCPDTLEMLYGIVHGRYKMTPVAINPTGGR